MTISYDERGLVPVIAQDARTGRLLMLAWADEAAVEETVRSGFAHYHSRSRGRLWKKGESSGHVQRVVEVRLDCDGDALLYQVDQTGPACHTGEPSCFYRALLPETGGWAPSDAPPSTAIERLAGVVRARKGADPGSSYTARLLSRGMPAIVAKVREESEELAVALESESDARVVSEAADVVYHAIVGLESRGIAPGAVCEELARRFGVSGLVEKAQRTVPVEGG